MMERNQNEVHQTLHPRIIDLEHALSPSRLQQVYNGRTGVEKEVSSVTGNIKMVLKSGLRRYSVHPDSHCKTGGMS